MTTWILTGSPDNFAATRERGFSVIGLKERNRNRALEIERGDRIVFWLTQVQRFAGSVTVSGDLFEDREKIWPGKPGKVDAYPWRFDTEPEIVLDEDDFVPAVELAGELEHVRKWPAEHWHLAFQGQLRTVPDCDAEPLTDRIRARDRLGDSEAREALSEAGPTNGGGDPGRTVSEGFLELRDAVAQLQALEVQVRDLDRGLIDFPS